MMQVKSNDTFSSGTDRDAFAFMRVSLFEKGYSEMFRREPTCIFCSRLNKWFSPGEFVVDARYEFRVGPGPEAERFIYAVTTNTNVRGILVDSYGVYADNISPDMFRKFGNEKMDIRTEYTTAG